MRLRLRLWQRQRLRQRLQQNRVLVQTLLVLQVVDQQGLTEVDAAVHQHWCGHAKLHQQMCRPIDSWSRLVGEFASDGQ